MAQAAEELHEVVRLFLASHRVHHAKWSDSDALDALLQDPAVRGRLTMLSCSAGQLVDAKLRHLHTIQTRWAMRAGFSRWREMNAPHCRVSASDVVRRVHRALEQAAVTTPLARVARRRLALVDKRARRHHALVTTNRRDTGPPTESAEQYAILAQCELVLTGVDPTSEAALRARCNTQGQRARRRHRSSRARVQHWRNEMTTVAQVTALARDAPTQLARDVVTTLQQGMHRGRRWRLRAAWRRFRVVTAILRRVEAEARERKRVCTQHLAVALHKIAAGQGGFAHYMDLD